MDKKKLLGDLTALFGLTTNQPKQKVETVDPNEPPVQRKFKELQNTFREVANRAVNQPIIPFAKGVTAKNMEKFVVPLEKETKNLSNTIKSTFPIVQVPEAIGEQVRQAGRIMMGKPQALDVAGAVIPMAGSMKLKKVLSEADELVSEKEKFAVIMDRIAAHDALSAGGVEGASDYILNEGKIRQSIVDFAKEIFGKKAIQKKQIEDVKDMLFQYIRAEDYDKTAQKAKPFLNKKPIVQKKPTEDDLFFLKKIVLDAR